MLKRLTAIEENVSVSAQVIIQLAHDAKTDDGALDAQIRAELNSVTSQLGNDLRLENANVAES